MPVCPPLRREHSLDAIRMIAIIAVICEHVSPSLLTGKAQLIFNTFGTAGVPLFVMLTGYLMLDRRYNSQYLKRFLRRNLLTLIIAMEIWNLAWFVLSHFIGAKPISLSHAIKVALFMGPTDNAMWFLPMIIGIYLGLPIVAGLVQWLAENSVRAYALTLLCCVLFFGSLVPTLSETLSIAVPGHSVSSQLNMNIFGAAVWGNSVWVLFLIAGYAVKKGMFSGVRTWVAVIVAIISSSLLILFHYIASDKGLAWDPYYPNALLVIMSVSFFVVAQRVFTLNYAHTSSLVTIVTTISKYSFSVYMLHRWILVVCISIMKEIGFVIGLFPFITITLVCLLASLLVTRILGFIGPLREWMLLIK